MCVIDCVSYITGNIFSCTRMVTESVKTGTCMFLIFCQLKEEKAKKLDSSFKATGKINSLSLKYLWSWH